MDCLQLIFSHTLQMAHDGRKDGRHDRRCVRRIKHPELGDSIASSSDAIHIWTPQ